MQAMVLRSYGGAEMMTSGEVETPQPGAGQISIDVAYAGVGYVDTMMRRGKFDFLALPLVLGMEVAGHVRALGAGVSGLQVGQPVGAMLFDFTRGGLGGYAEVAVAEAGLVVPLAENADLAVAAGTLVNGATAELAVEGLLPGANVAITGATGGLGRSLIAAARSKGADRIVAISSKVGHADLLRRVGASEVMAPADTAKLKGQLDAVYESVGGDLRLALLSALKPRGHMHLLGNAGGHDTNFSGDAIWMANVTVSGLATGGLAHLEPARIMSAADRAVQRAFQNAEAPTILPLRDVAEAHRMLESGSGGKYVLDVRN